MKKIENLIIIIMMMVIAPAFGQTFEYSNNICRYTKLVPENKKVDWEKTSKTGYTPLHADARLHQAAEKCTGWYFQPSLGVKMNVSPSQDFSPMVGMSVGYEIAHFGKRPNNFGLAFEVEAKLEKNAEMWQEDLSYIKAGYIPTIGGKMLMHFTKHKPFQVAFFGGAGYTRLTSHYPNASDPKDVTYVKHNTLTFEGGIQMGIHVMGHSPMMRIGVGSTQTAHVRNTYGFISVSVKFKKLHKSMSLTAGEYFAR